MPGISPKINYDFNQIQTGLISFIGNMELKLQEFIPDLPVFVMQTGDASYFLTTKFEEIAEKEVTQKIPRFILSFLDVQPLQDQNTNQYNIINFKRNDENGNPKIYTCKGRRIAINILVDTSFVSSNFVKMLENYEIMSTITARQNAFTYNFLGNTYEGAYNYASNANENPSMDMSSASRNSIVKTSFDLQLHLFVPRIESIRLLSESEIETVRFDLNVNTSDKDLLNKYQENFDIHKTDFEQIKDDE
jgi:hypothetical protein